MYDYVIVGAGLYGSTFAHQAKLKGKKCLVIDKRIHIGGNVFCENIEGINVHKYGPHIFHTNDKAIWEYVNLFTEFNGYIYSPIANYKGQLYNLPFNMNTFYQMWGVRTPEEAAGYIHRQIEKLSIKNPRNLEEQALSLVGSDIYKKLIKGYTEKHWGRPAKDLPAFIIKRLPVRYTFDNNYFNDDYQGIPIGGYNRIIEGMLDGVEVKLGVDFFKDKTYFMELGKHVVYTGQIDEYFEYRYGHLDYRSLRFEHEHLEIKNFQGNAGVNYTSKDIPYTRIIEHKHFERGAQPSTVITKEYPLEWKLGREPYYPINDAKNNKVYLMYRELASREESVIFGGRLANYRYYDMHQVIASALSKSKLIVQ